MVSWLSEGSPGIAESRPCCAWPVLLKNGRAWCLCRLNTWRYHLCWHIEVVLWCCAVKYAPQNSNPASRGRSVSDLVDFIAKEVLRFRNDGVHHIFSNLPEPADGHNDAVAHIDADNSTSDVDFDYEPSCDELASSTGTAARMLSAGQAFVRATAGHTLQMDVVRSDALSACVNLRQQVQGVSKLCVAVIALWAALIC
jgi:hypothetical protein